MGYSFALQEDTAAGGVRVADDAAPMEEDDEVDPLDAFMSQNDAHATQLIKQAQEKAQVVEEEIDPLDAFMAAEVMPAVTQNGLSKTPHAQVRCPQPLPDVHAPQSVPACMGRCYSVPQVLAGSCPYLKSWPNMYLQFSIHVHLLPLTTPVAC